MSSIIIDLELSREQCESWYAGDARFVQVLSRDGRSVRFPFHVLRPFLDHQGVRGSFLIRIDDRQALQSIKRLS